MDERLELAPAPLGYRADVRDGQLAREDHAAEPEVPHGEHSLEIVRDELRGGVEAQPREEPPRHARDAEVLDYQRVRRRVLERREELRRGWKLTVRQQGVERHVDATALRGGDGQEVGELPEREVHGLRARGERVQPEVDGVRAGLERGQGRVEGPGRRKELDGTVA